MEKRNVPLHGIIGYPITPFQADGGVDLSLLKKLIDRMLAGGVHGIAPLGSTGVLPYLSDDERQAVTETTVESVADRVPTLVGISAMTTERAVYHGRFAERVGATAVMMIPMSYWKLTEEEIFRHFSVVADSLSIPVMAYNNPATGGLDLKPEFLARLLTIPNVTMVKESTGDLGRVQRIREIVGDDVAFFNGSNPLALGAFAAGARGWCTAGAHIIPEFQVELYRAIQERNDLIEARKLFYQQLPLLEFLVQGGLPRTIAAALELLGINPGPLRAPLQQLTRNEQERLRTIMQKLNLLDPGTTAQDICRPLSSTLARTGPKV